MKNEYMINILMEILAPPSQITLYVCLANFGLNCGVVGLTLILFPFPFRKLEHINVSTQ
jgi:hypothetical protein